MSKKFIEVKDELSIERDKIDEELSTNIQEQSGPILAKKKILLRNIGNK